MILRSVVVVSFLCLQVSALTPAVTVTPRNKKTSLMAGPIDSDPHADRRSVLERALFLAGALTISSPEHANALVKGVAPPEKKAAGNKPKCTNVEECQALAERREQELREQAEQGPPPKATAGGVRYIEVADGSGTEVKEGDDVQLYFKVLKLGKRSYDGLSGEGTVVFSRGYGLEDDESSPGSKSFQTTVGGFSNIKALNEALVGMKVGGVRRFSILPQKGWERAIAACDGGPGGKGSGGDLKTGKLSKVDLPFYG